MDRNILRIIDAKYDRYAREVVNDIKGMPEEVRLSPPDLGLQSFWEEYVVQVRGEESIDYDMYVETIREVCKSLMETLPGDEQMLLWCYTDEYDEEDEVALGSHLVEAVGEELFTRVTHLAGAESLSPNMERVIYGPDEEDELEENEADDDSPEA